MGQSDKSIANKFRLKKMEKIVYNFLELADELEADPDMELIKFETYRGVSEADIEHCEQLVGMKLSQEVQEFYKITNGFQLIWQSRDSKDSDFGKHSWIPGAKPPDYSTQHIGCINIWPLNDVFDKDWSEDIYFQEDKSNFSDFKGSSISTYEIKKKFFPFDLYSRYSCFGFFCLGDKEVDRVVLSQDYYIDFSYSKPVTFKSYLEFLLVTKGKVSFRKFFVGDKKFSDIVISHDASLWRSLL